MAPYAASRCPRLAHPFVEHRGDQDSGCGSENPDASTLVGGHWKNLELNRMYLRERDPQTRFARGFFYGALREAAWRDCFSS